MSRGIPVYCRYGKRLVNVDFDDFDKTKEAVRKKWNLQGDFVLQVPDGKGEYMDIVDDDDLRAFRNAESLTVHLLDGPPGAVATPNVGQTPPPSYEQSVHPATATPQPQHQPQPKPVENKMTVGVEYETSAKRVSIFTENLQKTKQAIRQKFPAIPDDDFDLFAEISGQDDILINNDADLSQYKDADSFQVQRRVVQPSKPKPGKNVSTKSNEKRVAVIYDGKSKLVPVNFESLDATKEEIRKRFNLSGDIDIQGQLPGSVKKYDIEDDTELMEFKDAEEFHVRAHPSATHTSSPDQGRDTNRPLVAPMSQDPNNTQMKSLPVSYRGRRKSVMVKLDDVDSIRMTIQQRFKIAGDFSLKVKVGQADHDIEDEDDLDELRAANELVVEDIDSTPTSQQIALVTNTTQDLYLKQGGKTAMVQYRGMNYGLYQPPPPKSQVVLEQKEELNETLNIAKLVDKMELTADFLRLAYYGVLGKRELHEKIQHLQFAVGEVSKECGSTAVQFKIKAGDVIDNLECGFTYLFEGNNDFALENFKQIATISEEVLKKTNTLKDNLGKNQKELTTLLALITKEHGDSLDAVGQITTSAATEKNLRSRIEKCSEETSQLYAQCRKYEADITKSKSEIAKAEESKKPVRQEFFRWVKQGYLYKSELDSVVTDKEKMLQSMSDEERLKELEQIRLERWRDQNANRELLQIVEALKKTDILSGSEGMLTMALRGAQTGIKSLLNGLRPIIEFWAILAVECESIANTGTVARMQQAAGGAVATEKNKEAESTERNKEFWKDDGFKRQALKFYARWVALRLLCRDFQMGMERVADGIHLCIQDNPNVEQARKRIKALVTEVDDRVQREKEALEKTKHREINTGDQTDSKR